MPFVYMFTRPISTDKTNGFDGRMVADGIDGGNCSVNNVDHARWQTWLSYGEMVKRVRVPNSIPARSQSSAMIIAAPGSRSEGLRISVFPVTAAIGIVHSGIMLRNVRLETLPRLIIR